MANNRNTLLNKAIEIIKWFAEVEKRGAGIGTTYDRDMALIRLVVLLGAFSACILCWFLCAR